MWRQGSEPNCKYRHTAPLTMAEKKSFILRINPDTLKEIQKWADDEFRSVNGQIEYLLQSALINSGWGKAKEKKPDAKKK